MPPEVGLIVPLLALAIQGYIVYALNMMKSAIDEIMREHAETPLAEPYRKLSKGLTILANLAFISLAVSIVSFLVAFAAMNR